MLTCAKCNYENELGRIFCHQCGTKLDIESIKPPSRGGKSLKKSKWSVGRIISLSLRIVILAALIIGIFLIFQVPAIQKIETTTENISTFYRKRNSLDTATLAKKPIAVSLSEAELNAFVNNIQTEKPEGRGVAVVPTLIQIEFNDETATAFIIGKIVVSERWEKGLGISYTGVPAIEDGKFVFRPVTARIGKLRIPRVLLENTPMVENYYSQVFGRLDTEIQLLNKLTSIAVAPDNVVLEYKPAKPDATNP